MQLVGPCLGRRGQAGFAIAVAARVVGQGQAGLQQLDVQVPVVFFPGGFVPHPHQVAGGGGVRVPGGGVRFDQDRFGVLQLVPGEGGSLLAPLLDAAGGFGRVDGDVARFQHAAWLDLCRHVEMRGVAVHEGAYRDLLFGGFGLHVQRDGTGPVCLGRQLRRTGGAEGNRQQDGAGQEGHGSQVTEHRKALPSGLYRL